MKNLSGIFKRSIKRAENIAFLLAGAAFLFLFFTYRTPDLYNGLWEDEVHYSKPPLDKSGISGLRNSSDTGRLMRPMLGGVLWKGIFSEKSGLFTPSERNLHALPLTISILHLAMLFFLPWTESRSARFITALLVAFSGVEGRYATEAQSYSLVSLMGSATFTGLAISLKALEKGAVLRAMATAGFTLFLSANTHFFNLGILAAAFAGWLAYALTVVGEARQRRRVLTGFIFLSGLIAGATYLINKPILDTMFLFASEMGPDKGGAYSPGNGLIYLTWNWEFLGLPGAFYCFVGALGLLHPLKRQRFLSASLIAGVFVFKAFLCAYCVYKSVYSLSGRHLIMYLGPAALLFGLGVDCAVLWAGYVWRRISASVPALNLELIAYNRLPIFILCVTWLVSGHEAARASVEAVLTSAQRGLTLWRTMPANYSLTYHFLERVKKLNRPALVLTNHCWGHDIPELYLHSDLGSGPAGAEIQVLPASLCGITLPEFTQKADRFMRVHRKEGLVVYFFEVTNNNSQGACASKRPVIHHQKRDENSCVNIYSASEMPLPLPL